MKNLILVALILQLVITITKQNNTDPPKFGDIMEFPRKCVTDKSKPIYKHFGVYVGPKSVIDVGQGDNDIFHRTGNLLNKYSCGFGKLAEIESNKASVANHLDGKEGFTAGTPEQIKARIIEWQKSEACGKYSLTNNNCEHLATKMRYGRKESKQTGTIAECVLNVEEPAKDLLKGMLEHMKNEALCENGF